MKNKKQERKRKYNIKREKKWNKSSKRKRVFIFFPFIQVLSGTSDITKPPSGPGRLIRMLAQKKNLAKTCHPKKTKKIGPPAKKEPFLFPISKKSQQILLASELFLLAL